MLILTRKTGETIVINDNIRVRVLQIRGGQVRIGVEAPADIAVHRSEIHKLINGAMEKPHVAGQVALGPVPSSQSLDLTRRTAQRFAEQNFADPWIYFQHCDPSSASPHS